MMRIKHAEWRKSRPRFGRAAITHLPGEIHPDRMPGADADAFARRIAADLGDTDSGMRIADARFVRSAAGDRWHLLADVAPVGWERPKYAAPIAVLCAADMIGATTASSPYIQAVGTGSYQLYAADGSPAGRCGGDWTADLPRDVREALHRLESIGRSRDYCAAVVRRRCAAPENRERLARGYAPRFPRYEIPYFIGAGAVPGTDRWEADDRMIGQATAAVARYLDREWPGLVLEPQ